MNTQHMTYIYTYVFDNIMTENYLKNMYIEKRKRTYDNMSQTYRKTHNM
jgi:hypothetical protein